MKVVALISGGKDSCYNMMQCVSEGHEIIALANLYPETSVEIDSYMFQTVGHHVMNLYAEAMDLPLYRKKIDRQSVELNEIYNINELDEVEDMYELLKSVKELHDVEAVSVGAILSNYQRVRVENVCQRLHLLPLAYLWQRDQEELLHEMIACGVDAIVIKVASLGLSPKLHLGRKLCDIEEHLVKLNAKYGVNICGEGGEYETFTLDCPLFKKRIKIDEMETIIHSSDDISSVAYLYFKKASLIEKDDTDVSVQNMKYLPMLKSNDLDKVLLQNYSEFFMEDTSSLPIKPVKSERNSMNLIHIKEFSSNFFCISGFAAHATESLSLESSVYQTMINLKDKLTELDLSVEDLCLVNLFVSDMNNFSYINSIYERFFKINPPCRVCVEVCLPENMHLLIYAIGYKKRHQSPFCKTLNVQTYSHWAPASIGPYSQAIEIYSTLFIAGQVGLCPCDSSIINGGIVMEGLLSLRSLKRIIEAIFPNYNPTKSSLIICYIIDVKFIPIVRHLLKQNGIHDQYSISNDYCSVLIEFVVISSLPKGALIEWQTFVFSGRNSIVCEKKSYFNNFVVGAYYMVDKMSSQLHAMVLNLSNDNLLDNFPSNDGLDEIITHLVKFLYNIWVQIEYNEDVGADACTIDIDSKKLSEIKLATFYYKRGYFEMDLLYSSLTKKFRSIFFENSPVISMIPVNDFEKKDKLLSVYLF